jgi:molybdenum cofactor cytidylyltransferase
MNQENTNMKFSVVILAAGNSIRMGKPKFLLNYSKKITFLEKIILEFKNFESPEIVIVVNESNAIAHNKYFSDFGENVHIVINSKQESDRFYSLKLGLEKCNSQHLVFVVNVDNPFVNAQLINELLKNIKDFDFVIPTFQGKGGHPILIQSNITQAIISTASNNLNLKNYLSQFRKNTVETTDDKILMNINTKEDYAKYFIEKEIE